MLKRNAAVGEVLRESAPRREIQLVGLLQLRKITFQARTLGEQPEDAALVEHADVVFPHHVVDSRQLLAVAHQDGRETSEAISHDGACGIGIATAKPARYTGWGNPSGATSAAEPRGSLGANRTEPSATMFCNFFRSPERAGLSTRPPREISE